MGRESHREGVRANFVAPLSRELPVRFVAFLVGHGVFFFRVERSYFELEVPYERMPGELFKQGNLFSRGYPP